MRRAALLLSLVTLATAGCGEDAQVELSACLFLDDREVDGIAAEGESLVMVFSRDVQLVDQGVPGRGFVFLPAGSELVHYHVQQSRPGSDRIELILDRSAPELAPLGIHGVDERASGVRFEPADLPGLRPVAGEWSPTQHAVDLSLGPIPPAALVSAEWIDSDRNYSVSEGDQVRLRWDRRVEPGESLRRNAMVPSSMFELPLAGDRLDDGDEPSRLVRDRDDDPHSLRIQLGSRPRFDPDGDYQDLEARSRGASGIAVAATEIRRQLGIVDELGFGVADSHAVDIAPAAELRPFSGLALPRGLPADLVWFGLTALPDGRILVTGGSASAGVLDQAWLWNPQAPESCRQFKMSTRRHGHSATYFSGPDLEEGTADDFVAIVGGTLEPEAAPIEVFHPFTSDPVFRAIDPPGFFVPRMMHTAHVIPALQSNQPSQLLIVGGSQGGQLLGNIDRVEFHLEENSGLLTATIDGGPKLRKPRARHQSVLLELDGGKGYALFVYGGMSDYVDVNAGTAIAAPELFQIADTTVEIDLGDIEAEPGPRFGHRMVPLLMDPVHQLVPSRSTALIVGGSPNVLRALTNRIENDLDSTEVWRVEIDLERSPALWFERAGNLPEPRTDAELLPLPDGRVLVLGGIVGAEQSDPGYSTARALVVDPDSGLVERFCQNSLAPRAKARAVALGEYRWLILGGGTVEATAELLTWPDP